MPHLRLMFVTATLHGTDENMDLFVMAETAEARVEKMSAYYELDREDFYELKVWNLIDMQAEDRTGDVIEWHQKHCTTFVPV